MSADMLLEEYRCWLHTAGAPGTDVKLTSLVRERLLGEPELHGALHTDAFSLIASGLRGKPDLRSALQRLAAAFELLEQATLHLYYTPWRKEFLTIKTYSGSYVHVLEAALPQDGIFRALQRLGYEPREGEWSLSLLAPLSAQSLSAAALAFRAAQVECHILSDVLSSAGTGEVSGIDLLRERRSCRGEAACVERLRRLMGGAGASAPQVSKTPVPVAIWKGRVGDPDGGTTVYQPQFCDQCHEPWGQHVGGHCRKTHSLRGPEDASEPGEGTGHPAGPQVGFVLHDCVFSDMSLERGCAECHVLHSSWCKVLKVCGDLGHHVTRLCPSEKRAVLMEEERCKYRGHACLQPGHLPHYRCATCRHLHYIKCDRVVSCRAQGHRVTMIMLEKDQRLWLQRSEIDLVLLGLDLADQTEGRG
ncbi:spermatogenesis-associated protein 2-like protein [Ascaphus truei]|uniref:spermatogenesis-associated protein 2-like protein n=1 Tax=Ascaphus truei TaxID=8439 RepID=UPI003F5A5B1C